MRARRLLTSNKGYTLAEVLIVLIILGVLITIGATFFFGAQKRFEDNNAKQVLANAVTSALKSAQSNGSTPTTAQNENSFPSYPSLIAEMTPEHSNKVITGANWAATNGQAKGTVVIDTTLSGPRHIVMYTQTPEGRVWEVAVGTDGKSPVYAMVNTIGAPVSAGAPQILGATYVGNTLTTDPGAWLTGASVAYGYQWRRCDTAGTTCADIPGAISSTYALTSSDLGTTLKVVVTATNASGSATATSSKTGVVVRSTNSGPENTNKPTITGIAAEKQTLHNDLTGQQGSWTGRAPITIARQWQRCDASGQNCVDIASATASTYLLAAADIGSTVRVNVIATDANGTNTAASDPTAVVGMAIPIVGAPPPSISGTASDQHVLTANNGTWSSSGTITYSYQWRRCNSSGASCVDIPGATAQTYTLAAADIGSTVRVVVTATNAGGPQPYTTAQTAVVVSNPPAATTNPSITGTAQEGSTLTGNDGSWTGTVPVSFARQWRRCDSAGASCVSIGGATGTTYALVAADIGSTIRYQVTGTNVAGNSTATSSATAVVQALPPSGGTVTVTGAAVVGQTLTATPSGWTSSVAITYTYQWRRCDSAGASCADIAGQTANTYSPVMGDLGNTLRVVLTATNSGGANTATSAATQPVVQGVAAGTVIPWAGTSVPAGWVLADGSAISRTTNSDLFATVGTTYGAGDGSTTFNVPDLRNRAPLGKTASFTTYASTILADNPVSYWRLGEASGATAADQKGANAGTYGGGVTYNQPGAIASSTDTAVTFNGSTGWVNAGNAASEQVSSGTAEAWFKTSNAGSGWTSVIVKQSAWSIFVTDNVLTMYDWSGPGTISTGIRVNDNRWHYAAVSFRSGVANGTTLYLDGVAVWTGTYTIAGQGAPVAIGANGASPIQFFTGTIDDAAFYNAPLSGAQIAAHYAAGVAQKASALGDTGGIGIGTTTSIALPWMQFTYNWSEAPPAPGFGSHADNWYGPWGPVWVKPGPCQYCDNEPYAPVSYYATTESGSPYGLGSLSTTSATLTPTVSASYGDPPYMVARYIIATTTGALAPCGGLWATGRPTGSLPAGSVLSDGTNTSGCLAANYAGKFPDLRSRIPFGQSTSGAASALAANGGALAETDTFTLPNQSVNVTASYAGALSVSSPAHSDAESRGQAGDNSGCSCYTSNPWGGSSPMSHGGGSDNGAGYTSNTYSLNVNSNAAGGQTKTGAATVPYTTVNWVGYASAGYGADSGTITAFAGSSAPTGWLLADGSCVSRTSYSALFAAIGTTYGAGDGSTTFCLPDLRGRLPVGAGATALGTSGGAMNTTVSANFSGFTPQITIPAHTFSWSIPSHQHNDAMYKDYTCCDMSTDSASMYAIQQYAGTYTWNYAWTQGGGGQTVSSTVGAQTINPTASYPAESLQSTVNPPFVAMNYVIKT